MKTIRKNNFKFFVLILAAVFISQTLCFGLGKAYAETSVLTATPYVSALSADTVITDADGLVAFLDGTLKRNETVEISSGAGTSIDLSNKDYKTTNLENVVFNGNFCTILGLNKPLFGSVSLSSEIKNVYIGSGNIVTNTGNYLGSIANESSNAKFINCVNNANVTLKTINTAAELYAGGIVGYARGTVIDSCSNHANVIVGFTEASSDKLPKKAYAGGIVGYAVGSTNVKNSYVISSSNSTSAVNIKAYASESNINSTGQSIVNKGTSKYYNGLSHVVTKVNEDIDKWKKEIAGYQSEASSLQKQIDKQHANIAAANNRISQLRKEKSKLKWYQVASKIAKDAQIALEGIKIAGYALEIAGLETSRAVVYGAITALQALLDAAVAVISFIVSDTSWVEFIDNAKKYTYAQYAYAYGIGYMGSTSAKIENVYTHNIVTEGGYRETIFELPLKFWSKSEWVGALLSSDDIKTKITFREHNNYGPIANYGSENEDKYATINNAYFFDSIYENNLDYTKNREIYIEGKDNGISYKTSNCYGLEMVQVEKHSIYVSIEKQQLILSTSGNDLEDITVYVNNGRQWISSWLKDYAGLGTKLYTFTFYGTNNFGAFNRERNLVGSYNNNFLNSSISNKQHFVKNNLDDTVWGCQESINNGLPYLKCRYWQEI